MRSLRTWDSRMCVRIHRLNGRKRFDRVSYLLSRSGDGYLYLAILLVVTLFDYETARLFVPSCLIAVVFEMASYKLLKQRIRRTRPFEILEEITQLVRPPDEFSFPSGHTAVAFLAALNLAHFYPVLALPVFTYAALVGLSRIYNGVHYPGDVAAGALLGLVSGTIGLAIML